MRGLQGDRPGWGAAWQSRLGARPARPERGRPYSASHPAPPCCRTSHRPTTQCAKESPQLVPTFQKSWPRGKGLFSSVGVAPPRWPLRWSQRAASPRVRVHRPAGRNRGAGAGAAGLTQQAGRRGRACRVTHPLSWRPRRAGFPSGARGALQAEKEGGAQGRRLRWAEAAAATHWVSGGSEPRSPAPAPSSLALAHQVPGDVALQVSAVAAVPGRTGWAVTPPPGTGSLLWTGPQWEPRPPGPAWTSRGTGSGFSSTTSKVGQLPEHAAALPRPRSPGPTHRLPGLAVVPFVTRGTVLALWGQKQVPSVSRTAPSLCTDPQSCPENPAPPGGAGTQPASEWGRASPASRQNGVPRGRAPGLGHGGWGPVDPSTYRGAGLSGGAGISGKTDRALKRRERPVQVLSTQPRHRRAEAACPPTTPRDVLRAPRPRGPPQPGSPSRDTAQRVRGRAQRRAGGTCPPEPRRPHLPSQGSGLQRPREGLWARSPPKHRPSLPSSCVQTSALGASPGRLGVGGLRAPPRCGGHGGLLTGLPLGPSSPGGPLGPGGPAAPEGPASPFSPLSPLGPCGKRPVPVCPGLPAAARRRWPDGRPWVVSHGRAAAPSRAVRARR